MKTIDRELDRAGDGITTATRSLNPREWDPSPGWPAPATAAVAALVLVLIVGLPVLLLRSGTPDLPSQPLAEATPTNRADTPAFGAPEPLDAPAPGVRLRADGTALYAATSGDERVLRSPDAGTTWQVVLDMGPGDSEGLYAAGRLVVRVMEDDQPPDAVTAGLRAYVFDPATNERREADLPRPQDPAMTALGPGEAPECALGGYQSWVLADAVAAGERLVVTGHHQLVGRLADGSVICDGQAHRHHVWTSDDDGRTWQLHPGPPLGAITWTGERFVGWSVADNFGAATGLVASTDGVTWERLADMPAASPVASPLYTTIEGSGKRLVALAVSERSSGDAGTEIAATVATSTDGGATWTWHATTEPLTAAGVVGETWVALRSDLAARTATVVASADAVTWAPVAEIPGLAFGPGEFAVAEDAIYVLTSDDAAIWRVAAP